MGLFGIDLFSSDEESKTVKKNEKKQTRKETTNINTLGGNTRNVLNNIASKAFKTASFLGSKGIQAGVKVSGEKAKTGAGQQQNPRIFDNVSAVNEEVNPQGEKAPGLLDTTTGQIGVLVGVVILGIASILFFEG